MINIEWSNEFDRGSEWIAPKCVVGLDRDGVINEDLGTYCYKSKDFKPIEGSILAITKLRELGHKVVIITNQGGIEKGVFTQDDVDDLHKHMFELLGEAGCQSIDGLYYSESSRKNDMYAKPNVGMFRRCEKEVPHVKFSQGYYVGDKISDLKAAIKVGAKPILVRTGYGKETEALINKRFTYKSIKKRTKVFDTLLDFVNYLED
jgi:D-glycero-D-manno-heptose 1,7-bisphosphate phosphatase|tara:strand:+ start:831 stop:1445 length:615 start_codon:yes stop_codon:yes gene_type:complete